MSWGQSWTVEVDHELCIGSGMCCVYAPSTFALEDGLHSSVVGADVDPLESVREAASACPTGAISLHPVEGGAGSAREEPMTPMTDAKE